MGSTRKAAHLQPRLGTASCFEAVYNGFGPSSYVQDRDAAAMRRLFRPGGRRLRRRCAPMCAFYVSLSSFFFRAIPTWKQGRIPARMAIDFLSRFL